MAGTEPPRFKLADGSVLALPDGGFEHFRV
jgi:hypothetical protein